MSNNGPTTIACLHAHHSNIQYAEQALEGKRVNLRHYVDPGMLYRKAGDDPLSAAARLRTQLQWISGDSDELKGVLITCTQYASLLDRLRPSDLPKTNLLPIDEPLFDDILRSGRQVVLAFTNPDTVEPTLDRLARYAEREGLPRPVITPRLIPDAFELVMSGRTEAYETKVRSGLASIAAEATDALLAAAQLSMCAAAEAAAREHGLQLMHPLQALRRRLESWLLAV